MIDRRAFDKACPKLDQSFRLDPLPKTLYALASCYEEWGKLATALEKYHEARTLSLRKGDSKRSMSADDRASQLAAIVSKLQIHVAAQTAHLEDITILDNGKVVPTTLWGREMDVDGGVHIVEAKVSGKLLHKVQIHLGNDRDRRKVTIPLLEDQFSPLQIGGILSGGLGVVGLGLGSYFGWRAIQKNNESRVGCDGNACFPEAKQARLDARSAGDASTTAFLVGAGLFGAGLVLYLVGSPASDKRPQVGLAPAGGASQLGLMIQGAL